VTRRAQVALLLDEMFSPVIAGELRRRGFDVIAVAADPQLRSMTDKELFIWAGEKGRRIVTENVKDFRPLMIREGVPRKSALLFTSSRAFPRSRRRFGPLLAALEGWLRDPTVASRGPEEWLAPPAGR